MTAKGLALHWQILIGMALGALAGGLLQVGWGSRTVEQTDRLASPVNRFRSLDTPGRIELDYRTIDGREVRWVVDATEADGSAVPSLESLRAKDPLAHDLFESHGQSVARRWGNWCQRFGNLFLRALRMVSVPLIVCSLVSGVLSIGSLLGLRRMFLRTTAYYFITTLLAILTGQLLVNLIRPGISTERLSASAVAPSPATSVSEVLFSQLENFLPANPLGSIAEPNFLSVIAFSLFVAAAGLAVGGRPLATLQTLADDGLAIMMALTMAIVRFAPVGVMLLMAYVVATQGFGVFRALGWYVVTVALGLSIHAFITLPLIVWLVAGRPPWSFLRQLSPALLTAFSTASSNATLPVTMECVEQNAGIPNRVASFVLPLGATVNMDGTALYEAVAVMFIAQLHFGELMPISQQLVVATMALIASVGAAGIPHAGLVMMVIVLQAVGLPLEMQGIILAVDRLLDMGRTTVNVWSDACGCAVIDRFEHSD
jgi:Na+/H+-dicarboxylate symporter